MQDVWSIRPSLEASTKINSGAVSPGYEKGGLYDFEQNAPAEDLTASGEDREGEDSIGIACGEKPSAAEVEAHERSHIPFRSWCKHCVCSGEPKVHLTGYKEKNVGYPRFHGITCT